MFTSLCHQIQHCFVRRGPPVLLCWGRIAETGLQMAFDDFVIEDNLVSCLRTNEVDRQNSGREEYSRLQIGEGEKLLDSMEWARSSLKKTAVTPPYLLITAIITTSLCRTAALDFFARWKLSVSGKKKPRGQMEVKLIYFCNYFNFFCKLNW